MDIKNLYNELLAQLSKDLKILPDKPEENAVNTLAALWHKAAGEPLSPVAAEKKPLTELTDEAVLQLKAMVKERLDGVPLAHLTERQHFMGLEYIVAKGLYIPRIETELLAQTAIDTVKEEFAGDASVILLDLCCGIGTVALAAAHYCSNITAYGSDIYTPAIEAAHINAGHFSLQQRSHFFNADLFTPFEDLSLKGKVKIIVSAPPYISSSKVKNMAEEISLHEPSEAFDAGPFGLSVFTTLIATAPDFFDLGGYLIFECGLGQGDFLAKRIEQNGHYGPVSKYTDAEGNVRVLKAARIR